MAKEIEIELRRKRIIFRAWHRGMRELDLILGAFADQHVDGFDVEHVRQFEQILEIDDPVLYIWISGKSQPPEAENTPVMRMILNFKYKD